MRKVLAALLVVVVATMGLVMALRYSMAPDTVTGKNTRASTLATSRETVGAELAASRGHGASAAPAASKGAEASGEAPKTEPRVREKTGPGLIRGEVAYPDGRKAVGVPVRLVAVDWEGPRGPDAETLRHETVSDSTGHFELSSLPVGGHLVRATAEDGMALQYLHLSTAVPFQEINFELKPAGPISGSVRDGGGQAVTGAWVRPHRQRPEDGWLDDPWAQVLGAQTGERGAFAIESLPAGEWRLYASGEGFAPATSEYVSTGTRDVVITLGPGESIGGRVVHSSTGKPVGGLTVRLAPQNLFRSYRESVSNDEGRFRFEHVAAGQYSLNTHDANLIVDGYPPSIWVTPGKPIESVVLPVTAGGVISGRVYDEATGGGIAGAAVYVGVVAEGGAVPPPDGTTLPDVKTEPDGSYRLSPLPTGAYAVRLSYTAGYCSPGPDGGARRVDVQAGSRAEGVDYALKKGVSISGTVLTGDGQPVPGVWVSASGGSTGSGRAAEPDGSFSFAGLVPAKDLTVTASAEGWVAKRLGPVELTEAGLSDLKLVLQPATGVIAGKVLTPAGTPVPEVRVVANSEAGSDSDSAGGLGRFRIAGLAAGQYKLFVRAERLPKDLGPLAVIDLVEGQVREDVVLRLDGAVALAGRVTDSAGKPLAGAWLLALGPLQLEGKTGADGTYALPGPGDESFQYRVQVTCPGYSIQLLDAVAGGSSDVDFVLSPGATVEGRVLDAVSGSAVPVFEVRVTSARSGDVGYAPSFDGWQTFNDPNGRYRLDGLPEGIVTLEARAEEFSPNTLSVQTTSGQAATDAVLVLEPSGVVEGTVHTADGTPVVGAGILAGRGATSPASWLHQPRVGVTDSQGKFRVTTLPADVDSVAAVHPAYAPGSAGVRPVRGRISRVDIVLRPAAVLSGHIYLDGKPTQSAWLKLSYTDSGDINLVSASVDAEGAYEFRGLSPGSVYVEVQCNDGDRARIATRVVNLGEGAAEQCDFQFPAADSALEGRVTVDGEPAQDVQAVLHYESSDGVREEHRAECGMGYYRLDRVPTGQATLMVQGTGPDAVRSVQSLRVNVAPGRANRRDTDLSGLNTLVGTVVGWRDDVFVHVRLIPGALPFAQANAGTMRYLGDIGVYGNGISSTDGSFRFERLPDGIYTVVAEIPDPPADDQTHHAGPRYGSATVNLRGGKETTVQIPVQ